MALLCVRCAQITPLTGGKKDTDPPKIIKSAPENASLNFKSDKIEIQFDEYITLKDILNQFIITPQTREVPEITAGGKKITIRFKDSLLPNTTYKLSFGNAITDLRESNALANYEYVLSTGNTIDSLKMKGRVLNYDDKKPSASLLIGLYSLNSNDSIIYKEKPLYISKTDDNGAFTFSYLPDKLFRIAGIKDKNKNLLYDGSEEQLAYSGTFVNPKDTGSTSMLLFQEVPGKSFIKKAYSVEYGKAQVNYNKPQPDLKDVKGAGVISYLQNGLKDTLTIYYRGIYDTLQTYISYQAKKTDTLNIRIASLALIDKQKKNKSFKYTLQTNVMGSLPFYDLPRFDLNVPVDSKRMSEDRIILTEEKDSVQIEKAFALVKGSGPVTSFTLQSDFKPETNYTIILQSSVFTDETGRSNDSIAYKFRTTSMDDYGQLTLKLFFPKKESYIVMLLNDKGQITRENLVEFSLTSTSEKLMEYKNLLPGSYYIKIAEDTNKNGHFDTGNYFTHRQPEPIFINSTAIKLLAGWEIENEWRVE